MEIRCSKGLGTIYNKDALWVVLGESIC